MYVSLTLYDSRSVIVSNVALLEIRKKNGAVTDWWPISKQWRMYIFIVIVSSVHVNHIELNFQFVAQAPFYPFRRKGEKSERRNQVWHLSENFQFGVEIDERTNCNSFAAILKWDSYFGAEMDWRASFNHFAAIFAIFGIQNWSGSVARSDVTLNLALL